MCFVPFPLKKPNYSFSEILSVLTVFFPLHIEAVFSWNIFQIIYYLLGIIAYI